MIYFANKKKELNAIMNPVEIQANEVFDMLDDYIREEERTELMEKYSFYTLSPFSKDLTSRGHQILVGKAMATAKRVIQNGGTAQEVSSVLKYLYVCINARKHKLNHKQCRIDLDIDTLNQNYREVTA